MTVPKSGTIVLLGGAVLAVLFLGVRYTKARADLEQSRKEVRIYIQAAALYNQRLVNAEGLINYMRQIPACTVQ